jgi:branched-subunit amino acid transport protein
VSWAAIIGLAVAAYALKALGPLVIGARPLRPGLDELLAILAVPVLAALVILQTVDGGGRLVLDARTPALAVAALLVWRRAPILVVVVAAAATAALLRALS